MAWVDIKKKSEPHIYRVPSQAYKDVYKEQGFVIVDEATENAPTSVSTAQNAEVDKPIEPAPKTPTKRKYERKKGNSEK